MKAVMKGLIQKITRVSNDTTEIELAVNGRIDKNSQLSAVMTATFLVKPRVADELKFGQVLHVVVSDVEPEGGW